MKFLLVKYCKILISGGYYMAFGAMRIQESIFLLKKQLSVLVFRMLNSKSKQML